MKEVDDTPVDESESVDVDMLILETWFALWLEQHRVLERLADLETQRTANESNQDDPEWF